MSCEPTHRVTVPGECPDLEDLAALVDGRLAGEERARILEHLANCEACYEIFSETAHLAPTAQRAKDDEHVEAEQGTGAPAPLPDNIRLFPVARWRRGFAFASLAAAAMLVVVLLLRTESPASSSPLAVEALTASILERPGLSDRLGTDWGAPLAAVSRGPAGVVTAQARDFGIGVRLIDLQVALAVDDRAAAERWIGELLRLLRQLPGHEPLLAAYEDLRQGVRDARPAPELVTAGLRSADLVTGRLTSSVPFALGMWSESGRLAAAVGEREHFLREEVRGFLEELDQTALSAETVTELRGIEALLREDLAEEDLVVIGKAMSELLRHGGSP